MKKFALALVTGLGAYVLVSASAGSLAARRVDDSSGAAVIRDSRIESSVTATERRLLMLDQALYPETAATDYTITVYSKPSLRAYTLTKNSTGVSRTCSTPNQGGCNATGSW